MRLIEDGDWMANSNNWTSSNLPFVAVGSTGEVRFAPDPTFTFTTTSVVKSCTLPTATLHCGLLSNTGNFDAAGDPVNLALIP
jgi:hypothetical protein